MQSLPTSNKEILKRISGSSKMLKVLPPQPAKRLKNRIMRYSNSNDLPKIVDKKSWRSMPTTL